MAFHIVFSIIKSGHLQILRQMDVFTLLPVLIFSLALRRHSKASGASGVHGKIVIGWPFFMIQ